MGTEFKKNRFRAIGTRLAALGLALMLMGIPTAGNTSLAIGGIDYDQEVAEREAQIAQLKKDNEQRQQQIYNYTGSISDNEDAMDMVNQHIDSVNKEMTTYGELITIKQQEIDDKRLEIATVEQTIEDKEEEIKLKQQEIDRLEIENQKNLDKFAKLARALAIIDPSDSIPLLNSSKSWYDYFIYSDVIKNISKQNLDFMNGLLDDIHEQENMIEELDQEIDNLNNDKALLKEEQKALEKKMAELEQEKTDLQGRSDELYGELYDIAAENESLKNKVQNLKYAISATVEEEEKLNAEIKEIIIKKQQANSGQTIYSTDGFRWPLDTRFQLITTYFGWDAWRSGNHYGIDIGNAGINGQNIYAAQSGTVITAYGDGGYHGGFGNYVIIDHGGGICTLYAHCSAVNVYEGQIVNKGDVIAYVGSTGWSTGPHLHFEVRVNGGSVNPFNYSYEYV